MRLTFIYPAMGHRPGERYLRSWQMEPLPIATLVGLTPPDVDVRFYDDRMDTIPYDEPTDAVALPVETYTARRAYQIASAYRKRGVPVILGGFHTTLLPNEALRFGEAIVTGEAEGIWPQVIDDLRHGTLQRRYNGTRTDLAGIRVDRRLFAGKRYLPIGLIETGRGCKFPCEFCAVQTFFERSYRRRPLDAVLAEVSEQRAHKKLFFFVDDNFAGDMPAARELLHALATTQAPGLRWVTQLSIHAAHDEAFVAALARAGCRGVLIGFESLDARNLRLMHKQFNTMRSGFAPALANLRRHGIAVYGTFVFGYAHDTLASFDEAVDFALAQNMYVAAFNHLTPFPGTPLYTRLQQEGRLHLQDWWLNPAYRYNTLPFAPEQLTPEQVSQACLAARQRFYRLSSIWRRQWHQRSDFFMWRNFFPINFMHRNEVTQRSGHPLGDLRDTAPLLEVA